MLLFHAEIKSPPNISSFCSQEQLFLEAPVLAIMPLSKTAPRRLIGEVIGELEKRFGSSTDDEMPEARASRHTFTALGSGNARRSRTRMGGRYGQSETVK